MQFVYRDFNIKCIVEQIGTNLVGRAAISRVSLSRGPQTSHETSCSPAFATELKAIGYARNFAEMWCDKNFIDGCT